MTEFGTRLLALRELGLPALLPYASYRLKLASGLIRRQTPMSEWASREVEDRLEGEAPRDGGAYAGYRAALGRRFFFDATTQGVPWEPHEGPPRDLFETADEILAGRFRLFGGAPVGLGFPPRWDAFPPPLAERGQEDGRAHWTAVPLDRPGADVRLVWELSRFGWVFPLARAYRWTGAPKYADGCWQLIEDWLAGHPPNRGLHWASAQECGLRLVALAFAERAFLPHWSLNPARLHDLTRAVGCLAARIPPTIEYARAQGNNHLLSEATALFTAGLLFPELRPSDSWRRQGRRLLLEGLERQVFPDGGYVQHSANYHRLALGLAVWSARLAELNGEPLPPSTLTVMGRMARALATQADPESGRTAAFGPDDGSDVLPLASTESGDVRPIVAAASRLALGETWYPPGPWDEASSWLGLEPGVRRDPPHDDDLMDAGLHYLRGAEARAGLRCVRFHERPGHSDQLHVDLSYRGRPLVLDPGSYLYNGPPPWDDGLATAFVHNAPIIDGREAMRRAGRFLWVDRAQGTFESRSRHDGVQQMRASHDGYRRIGVHLIRTVSQVEEGAWLVSDVARAPDATAHRLTVGWNLPDLAWEWLAGELRLAGADGGPWIGWDAPSAESVRAGLVRAGRWVAGEQIDGPSDIWGWASPRYATIEPCLRLVLEITGNPVLCLRTRLAPRGGWPDRLLRIWDAPDAAGVAAP